jgi:hypothetical protein
VARDNEPDRPRRRWGRGREEEGPSDDELGWLADLRGSGQRDSRSQPPEAPSGGFGRGRRAEPPTGSMPTGGIPAGPMPTGSMPAPSAGRGRHGGDDEPRGRRGRDAAPPGPMMPPAAPPPAVPSLGDPGGSRGARRAAAPPPPPAPPAPSAPTRGRGGRAGGPDPTGSLGTGSLGVGAPRVSRAEGPSGSFPTAGRPAAPTRATGPGPAAPGGTGPVKALDPLVTTGMIRRAALRRHLRVAQQLKVATLIVVAILLLAAYPVYLFTKALAEDPVFGQLDALDLPGWAAVQHDDSFSGSRWCFAQCRYRERTWVSQHKPDDTNTTYSTALTDAGWRPRTDGVCPTVIEGIATCWQHDEYVMDMWVRAGVCDLPPPRPSIKPTATPSASAKPSPKVSSTEVCPAALVTVKVYNAIDYHPVD